MEDLELGLEERPKKVKGGLAFIVFLIGIAIGVTGGETLEGPVLGKREEEGRLLLTVDALQGAVLATFSERVAEINLLVDVGDTITLGVTGYEPFIDDPLFRGVRKATQTAAAAQPRATEPGAMIEGAAEGVPATADSAAAVEGSGDQEEAAGDTLQP